MIEYLEEDEQWSGSGLRDSEKAVSKPISYEEEIHGTLTVLAKDRIPKWLVRYKSRQGSRSLLQNPTHVTLTPRTAVPACGKRNITLNASWVNWKGLYVRVHTNNNTTKRRQVKFTMGPYPLFNLTICTGSCRGNGIENKAVFNDFHARVLARLQPKEAVKLQMDQKPCCVPSKYGKKEVLIVLNFVGKTNDHVHQGRVIGLKNAVDCECL